MTLLIRDATADDLTWVRSSWVSSYHDHTTHCLIRRMPSAEYYYRWRSLVADLLQRATTRVAYHTAAPDTVLGWVCYQPGTPLRLHYLHVRQSAQHRGLARELLDAAGAGAAVPCWYSHRTTFSDARCPDGWEFKPWMLIGV